MSRIRLTITLEQKILRFLDTIIDKKKIRNRSHAIEYVLKQYFDPQITKALVLVGGESDSSGQPFSMLKIAGKPTIGHIVEKLAQAGISHVVISLGKEGEKISKYLGDGSKWGVNITYINQKDPGFGTARA